jgi:hypothetical protein
VPETLKDILKNSAEPVIFSPDGSKIVYTATAAAEIPEKLISPSLNASTQKESRHLEPGKTYVYDIKEDKNFLIPFEVPLPTPTLTPKPAKGKTPTPSPTLNTKYLILNTNIRWFPTSRHLYWISTDKVVACEYDGTNQTTLYSGPFISPYAYAAPGANRLIILTQLNLGEEAKPNLYSVSLK